MFSKLKDFFTGSEKKGRADSSQLIKRFLDGTLGPLELCAQLSPGQGEAFEGAFRAMKENLKADPNVNQFKLNQIENIIKRGIEKKICEAHNIPYIDMAA